MKILVTFGSNMGGTEEIANVVAATLAAAGPEVDVKPAQIVEGIAGYDAVVVGGALYAGRWQRDARRFVQKNAQALHAVPVFFFSSGPLDDSASTTNIAPTRQVQKLMQLAGCTTHATFGGRLDPVHATGFIARGMVRNGKAGDFIDRERVAMWANEIAATLAAQARGATSATSRDASSAREPREAPAGEHRL